MFSRHYLRTGYSFVGWSENPDSELADYADEAEVINLTSQPDDTINLYAIWQRNAYTITFDANGGTGGSVQTVYFGDALTPPTVEKQWYSFFGWQPEVPDTVPDADSTYTAQWYNGISIDIDLEVGRYNSVTGDFVPLLPQETLMPGEIVTVRICPENDFYAGATRYVVMFDKAGFEIIGSNKDAFTPNIENAFYAAVAPDYTGTTNIPDSAWPAGFAAEENYEHYTAIAVGNRANSTSANGGYPDFLPGDWLFSFDLRVKSDIESGTSARIWMDERWIRNPSNTTGASYFTKCLPGQYSTLGDSVSYPYEVDLTGAVADIVLSNQTFVTVSFNLNGGYGTVPSSQYVLSSSAVMLPPQGDIEREHYAFQGWAESPDTQIPLEEYDAPETDAVLYAVWHRVPVALFKNPSASTVIDTDTGRIYGLSQGISFAQFKNSYVTIFGDGELREENPSGAFGTGKRLLLVDCVTEEVLVVYTVVIFGDVNGDGMIDGNDAGMIIDYENWMLTWDPADDAVVLMAGDLNGDGNVDSIDADLLMDVENWLMTIDQTTGLAQPG